MDSLQPNNTRQNSLTLRCSEDHTFVRDDLTPVPNGQSFNDSQRLLAWRLGARRSDLASPDNSSARATGLRVAARLFLRASMMSTTGAANAGCAFPAATSPP